ncbi:hypothetical protein [Nannocystis exedens]|uniref:hypothetical protein n=1 Tax=Nannocystis exedens TaxID=54 RepID=UPI001160D0CF|nr:hypothetical protein [Nannocystis exedens]
MRRARCTVAVAALVAGCLKPNPAYDSVETDGGTVGSTTTTTTSTTSTGVVPTSSTGTTEVTGTSAVTTSTATSGVLPDMSSGTTDTTTGEPTSCWDLGIDNWDVSTLSLDPPGSSPMLTPDAKTLHWRAFLGNEWHVIRSARDDPAVAFPAGMSIWPTSSYQADRPAFVAGTQELFFDSPGGDIYVLPRDGDGWGTPTAAGGAQAFGIGHESHPNPTADGAVLLFQRDDGLPFGQFQLGFNFYQITRDPQIHATFPDVPPVKVSPSDPGFGVLACPALAPDGLRLFFGAFDSDGGGQGNPNDGRAGVWFAERDSLDGGWHTVVRSPSLRVAGFVTCPVAVSADGCQLTLQLFTIGPGPTETRLARRG